MAGGDGDLVGAALGLLLVLGAAPVQGLDRALVLAPQADGAEPAVVDPGDELGRIPVPPREGGIEPRHLLAGHQQLEPEIAGVGDAVESDQAPGLEGLAPGDGADEGVALAQRLQRVAGLGGHDGLLGRGDDRRQRPVDVGEDRRGGGVAAQRAEKRRPGAIPRLDLVGHGSSIAGCRRPPRCAPTRPSSWPRSAPWPEPSAASSESAAAPSSFPC
jgi:hypothetical protein